MAQRRDRPGVWTSRFVSGGEVVDGVFPVLRGELATGPAQAAALPAPAVSLTSGAGAGRVVEVVLRPQRPVRLLALRVDGPRVLRAVVAGREVPAPAEGPFGVVVHAPPADGVRVTLALADGAGSLWVADGSDGLGDLPGFVPRPPEVGIAGSHTSELVLVARTVAFDPATTNGTPVHRRRTGVPLVGGAEVSSG